MFGTDVIIQDITFEVQKGDRVGLVGINGSGKTTLFKVLNGEYTADEGTFTPARETSIGYMEQHVCRDMEKPAFDEVMTVFAPLLKMEAEIEVLTTKISEMPENLNELIEKQAELNDRFIADGGLTCRNRAKSTLIGLGFAPEQIYAPIGVLSGGQKAKIQLAKMLLGESNLLLLDEPTNHLDIPSVEWLEDFLKNYNGSYIVISHDRYFLDAVTNRTFEIENTHLTEYKGNYTKYKLLKAEKNARLLKEYEKQQEEIAHLQDYVDRNLVRATTAKSALSRVKKLEKMEVLEKPKLPPSPPRFSFSYAERPYERVLEVAALELKAGERTLLKDASFTVMRGEKCAVVGDNGTGKSTLVREIVRGKNPAVKAGRFVKIACYDQENANLNPENTVLGELWERHVLWEQTKVRNILAQVKLDAGDMDKKVKMLSGGERAKLALAVFECENGNFLILDEPTNHLDLPARESLEDALKAFDGTVLFVSHDRYFIQALAGKIVELADGKIAEFKGTYEEYNACKAAAKEAKEAEEKAALPAAPKPKDGGYRTKEERAAETKKRLRIKQLEEEISALESEESDINAQLALPEIAADYARLSERCKRLEEVKSALDNLYEEYETLI